MPAATIPDARSPAGDALERAVAEEQERANRRISVLRLLGITAFVALIEGIRAVIPDWVGGIDRLVWYWLAAALAYGATRASQRVARLGGLAIPLVDVPMLFFVLSGVVGELQARGIAADARVVAAMAGLFFGLLVLLASFSLDDREIYVATAVAMLCGAPLIQLSPETPSRGG